MYLRGSNDYEKDRSWDKDGWVAGLTYGGAESSKPGSWGLLATYYDQSASTVIAHTMDGNWDTFVPGESGVTNGFKGWKVGGNLTLAKNMVAEVDYYDLKGKEGDQNGKHARTLWSQFVVTF